MTAPTAEEIAAARQHAAMLRDRFPERTRIENVAVALLAALDAAEAREKAAYRDGWDANVEASREILTRAETAERERDAARAAGFREGVAVTMEAFHAQLQKINVGDILAALKEAPRG